MKSNSRGRHSTSDGSISEGKEVQHKGYKQRPKRSYNIAFWLVLAFTISLALYNVTVMYYYTHAPNNDANQSPQLQIIKLDPEPTNATVANETYADDFPANKNSLTAEIKPEPTHAAVREDALTYAVCNGLSNQVLGHSAYIAGAISAGKDIRIPNAFIINGVQNEKQGPVLKDVFATHDNAVPLSQIMDTDYLIQVIQTYGVNAELEPFEEAVARLAANPEPCNLMSALKSADSKVAQKLLNSLRPSPSITNLVKTSIGNLLERVDSTSHATLSDGICLHHRNGLDWQEHCNQWENIPDRIWRKNCMNDRKLPLHELVRYRIPAKYPKSWIYYIGDEEPSDDLIEDFKSEGISLIHREKHDLLPNEDIAEAAHLDSMDFSVETHRDLFAVVDYFTCAEIESFIGNSVSTFSANQIALRNGMKSSWYNSRSIPLGEVLPVYHIPLVYTYTEESQGLGKSLLKASILSVRGTFGTSVDIHILYHGQNDWQFLMWLKKYSVIVHTHEPQWLDMIETMRQNGNPAHSHLFLHQGNYIGTWQRIDLPLFIDAEYVLFVDSDTIISNTFGMHDFGLDVTPGLAASAEADEDFKVPWNVGVVLFNVPKLRETHGLFMEFINSHTDNPRFANNNISDQGAYLEFYADVTQFLDTTFNVKPYWEKKQTFLNRKVVHFHGLKPHDFLKIFMGYPVDSWGAALHSVVRKKGKKMELACMVMHDFSKYISKDAINLQIYCEYAFGKEGQKKVDVCIKFFSDLGAEEGDNVSCAKHIDSSFINVRTLLGLFSS